MQAANSGIREPYMTFRAQVLGVYGNWVDGTLFRTRKQAETDADHLAELYDRPTRIVETQVSVKVAA